MLMLEVDSAFIFQLHKIGNDLFKIHGCVT